MTRYLHRQLTNAAVQALGCRYEGRIVRVEVQQVSNRWKFTTNERGRPIPLKEDVPVIGFEDGWDWIPNIASRRILTKAWGANTDGWVGRRMAVVVKASTRKGQGVEKLEKVAEPLEDAPSTVVPFPQDVRRGDG